MTGSYRSPTSHSRERDTWFKIVSERHPLELRPLWGNNIKWNPQVSPKSCRVYVGVIKTGLIDSFHDTAIGLLSDKPGCVFLGIDQGTQACDDVWIPNGVIILKGL